MLQLYFVPFVVLVAAYSAYSAWIRLDPRYPIFGAAGLLIVSAIFEAIRAPDVANTIAVYMFVLLSAGLILLFVDHVRDWWRAPDRGEDMGVGGSEAESEETERSRRSSVTAADSTNPRADSGGSVR